MTIMVEGFAKLMTHSKHMNVVIEPIVGYVDHIAMTGSNGILRLGVGGINVCLTNHSVEQVTLPKWTAVGETAAANAILALLVLRPTKDDSIRGEATGQQGKVRIRKNFWKKLI